MASFGFESLINEPTRVTNISQTCIDHVFIRLVSKREIEFEAQVLQTHVTDHYMTVLRLGCAGTGGGVVGRAGLTADCRLGPPPPAPRVIRRRTGQSLDHRLMHLMHMICLKHSLTLVYLLVRFMEKINAGINDGKFVTGLFIDIKKAFDTVDHEILLEKLGNCGFRANDSNVSKWKIVLAKVGKLVVECHKVLY
ncbi:hypothetical protein J6590_085782 [Homalodisca vitripennis]|nr:hypothetical protein J6590_085782 [Homalodisca vitripennis]